MDYCKPEFDSEPIKGLGLSETEVFLAERFMENTGINILDSGGLCGRQWQQNRIDGVKAFVEKPAFTIEAFGSGEDKGYISKNTYHYLTEKLSVTDRSKELDKQFAEFVDQDRFKYENYPAIGKLWVKELKDDPENEDVFGEGSYNTYNGDSALDTVLQYRVFTIGGDTFVLLQIHLGADVRGGYTNPRVLQVDDFDEFICDMNELSLYSQDHKHRFYSDDCGYHWYADTESDPDKIIFYEDKAWYRPDGKDSDIELEAS